MHLHPYKMKQMFTVSEPRLGGKGGPVKQKLAFAGTTGTLSCACFYK